MNSKTKMFSINAVYREEVNEKGDKINVFDHYDTSTLDNDVVTLGWQLSDADAERHTVKDAYTKLVTKQSDGVITYAKADEHSDWECKAHTKSDGECVSAWYGAKNRDITAYTMEYITKNDVYRAISVSVVKAIASNPKGHDLKNACLSIVFSGFRDVIFDDIAQDMYLCLFNLAECSDIALCSDLETHETRISFGFEYVETKKTDEMGNCIIEKRTKYLDCYKSVRATLTKYANHKVSDGKIVNIDAITELDNPMKYTHSEYMRRCTYDGAINDVIMRTDVNKFVKFLATTGTEKHIHDCITVFYGLLMDMDTATIARTYGLTIDCVKKRRSDLKKHYEEWTKQGGQLNIGAHDVGMLGNTTAQDFDVAMNAVYKHEVSNVSGKYVAVTRLGGIKWKKNTDINKPNEVLDWGMSHGKGTLKLSKAKKRTTTRKIAEYNRNSGGTISTENVGTLEFMPFYGHATAESADFTDIVINVLGENIGIDAVYDDYGNLIGGSWHVSALPSDYNTSKIAHVDAIKSGSCNTDKALQMCKYYKAVESVYPHDLVMSNPRLLAEKNDLIKEYRRYIHA